GRNDTGFARRSQPPATANFILVSPVLRRGLITYATRLISNLMLYSGLVAFVHKTLNCSTKLYITAICH
ncbi:hypothetical protein, partial [Alcanivorax jadensis]|uniref:hypothetical protein n=1 Tax=Alcanivorax jadensis TaxID=64988 RepID=UPI002356A8C2